jgi:hypothetical protein
MRAARRLALRSSRSSMVSLREESLASSFVFGDGAEFDLELFLDLFLWRREESDDEVLLLELELDEDEERDLFLRDLLR